MPRKEPRYLVHCGDASFYFKYGRLYRVSYLKQIFQKKLEMLQDEYGENREAIRMEFFPGLTLKDGEGKFWKPRVLDDGVVLIEEKP